MTQTGIDPNISRQDEAKAKRRAAGARAEAKQAAITEKIKNDYYGTPIEILVPCGMTCKGHGEEHGPEHSPEHSEPHRPTRIAKVYRAR